MNKEKVLRIAQRTSEKVFDASIIAAAIGLGCGMLAAFCRDLIKNKN